MEAAGLIVTGKGKTTMAGAKQSTLDELLRGMTPESAHAELLPAVPPSEWPNDAPAAFLFDVFGTLARVPDPRAIYQQLFAESPIPRDQVRKIVLTTNLGLSRLAQRFDLEADIDQLEVELADELASIELIEGPALAMLRAALEKGLPVGVISNLAQPYAEPVAALLPPLTTYVWSFEVGMTKPDQRIFRLAAERLGVPSSRIMMIGDSERADVRGARGSGMVAAHVSQLG